MAKQDQKGDLLEQAKLAEKSERYDDMADYMEEITKLSGNLLAEERNLLSVAFKNVVGSRRSSWRVISSLEQKDEFASGKKHLVTEYRQKVETELNEICDKVLVSEVKYRTQGVRI